MANAQGNKAHGSTHPRAPHSHRHTKAQCLKILRHLSTYLDNELAEEVCRDIRAHLGACPNCELFIGSLRRTITLCRHAEPPPLSAESKARLHRLIVQAIHRG